MANGTRPNFDFYHRSIQVANPPFQGTAGKLRLPVRSGLRPPPAPELARWAVSDVDVSQILCDMANGALMRD